MISSQKSIGHFGPLTQDAPPMKTKVNVHSTVELADHRRVESFDNGGWLDNAARVSATCTLGSAQEEQVLNKANDCQHRKHKAQSTSLAT